MRTARRRFKLAILAAGAVLAVQALCGGIFPATALAAEAKRSNIMIIYYSWSGNTRAIASQISQKVGGELVELELVTPYSQNYNTCIEEAKRDQTARARPELKTRINDFGQFDTVFIGYPNWWATIPMPIATLLESYDFSGKTIIPFCSHGGGRLGQSVADIAKLAPGATIKEALSVYNGGGGSLQRDIDAWLEKNGVTI